MSSTAHLLKKAPGATRVVLPGCGHLPNEETPELLATCLAEFMCSGAAPL